jgi:hypothetical protein
VESQTDEVACEMFAEDSHVMGGFSFPFVRFGRMEGVGEGGRGSIRLEHLTQEEWLVCSS